MDDMTTKRKHKPASEITIKAGDLFRDLPDDLLKASSAIARDMRLAKDPDEMGCDMVRDRLIKIYEAMWAYLMNEAIRNPGAVAKGPRLPSNVTFGTLMEHLAEAKRAQAEAANFSAWVREHRWPGGMQVTPSTARTWLRQYAKQIVKYSEQAELVKTAAKYSV